MTEKWVRNKVDMTQFIKLMMDPKKKDGPNRNYLEVKHRLVLLREIAPEAQITTSLLHFAPVASITTDKVQTQWGVKDKTVHHGGYAVYHARVELPDGTVGEGHKHETSEDFTDYAEKAETGAIGRAIAAAGIGVQYSQHDYEYESESKAAFVGVIGDAKPSTPAPAPTDVKVYSGLRDAEAAHAAKQDAINELAAESVTRDEPTPIRAIGDEQPEELVERFHLAMKNAGDGVTLYRVWDHAQKQGLCNDTANMIFLKRASELFIHAAAWQRINRNQMRTEALSAYYIGLTKQMAADRRANAS